MDRKNSVPYLPGMDKDTIRSIRYHLNLTQGELAALLGITQRAVSKWESQGVASRSGVRAVELILWLEENYPTILEQWIALNVPKLGPFGPYIKENKKDK